MRHESIGLARQNELDLAAATRHLHEAPAHAPGGQKICHHDLHFASGRQILAQGLFDGTAPAPRAAQQKLLAGSRYCLPGPRLAQPYETSVAKLSALKHFLKSPGQLRRQWAFEPQAKIVPATSHAVSFVLGSDVESAHECDAFVANQELAMIPNPEAMK